MMKKLVTILGSLVSVFMLAMVAANFIEAAFDPKRALIHTHAWLLALLMMASMFAILYATIRFIRRS